MEKEKLNKTPREALSRTKYGSTWLMYLDLCHFVNFTGIANEYFERSPQWFQQRIHGYKVHNKRVAFTPEEYDKLAESLRDLARRLITAADVIEKAEYYDINKE